MKNLIIGNTSQQSYYYPDDYIRISSREIDFDFLTQNKWDSVYITFAEQRIYNEMFTVSFMGINYFLTLDIIENIINNSNKIVIFTTCELWNNCVGEVNLKTEFNHTSSGGLTSYLYSKKNLYEEIIKRRQENINYNKVIIIHPFNFNSVYRTEYFLFGKIFDSIINKKQIEIGNTYFYRDIIHTKYLVERVISSTSDEIVGSGRLYHVNDFIRDLYKYFDMDYNYYVIENLNNKNNHSEKLYYSYQENVYTYDMLFNDTINDIKNKFN